MLQYSLCRKRCWAPGTGWAETSAQPGRADTPQCSAGGIERLQYLYWNKNITIYLLMAWDHWTPWVLGSPVCSDKSSAKNTKKHSTFSRKFYLSDSHRHVVNVCNIIIKAFWSYCDGVNSSWAGRYPRWVHQSISGTGFQFVHISGVWPPRSFQSRHCSHHLGLRAMCRAQGNPMGGLLGSALGHRRQPAGAMLCSHQQGPGHCRYTLRKSPDKCFAAPFWLALLSKFWLHNEADVQKPPHSWKS